MEALWNKCVVIVPTFNASKHLPALLTGLSSCFVPPEKVVAVDSSSADSTVDMLRAFGARVKIIPQSEFDHGGTRKMATALVPDAQIIIFMTQDAIPASVDAFDKIAAPFEDAEIGMTYGRQLARPSARGIERFSRLSNYGDKSQVRGFCDRSRFGIKTIFSSNSFAAYRRTALEAVGNFPERSYFAEDQTVAARMLLTHWKMAYAADACVYHSHDYSISQDFRRYFDIGVFHSEAPWLVERFGKPEGEGARFVIGELSYLLKKEPTSIPSAITRTFAKYAAYKMGLGHRRLPVKWKAYLGMHGYHWKRVPTRSENVLEIQP